MYNHREQAIADTALKTIIYTKENMYSWIAYLSVLHLPCIELISSLSISSF